MAARIIAFDHSGVALYGIDAHHGDDHAAAWAEDVAALVRAELGIDPIIVEYDPTEGGAGARSTIQSIHEVRLDLHVRPDQQREITGMVRQGISVGRALRVLSAPSMIEGRRSSIRAKPGSLEARANRWRETSDIATRRARRRLGAS